MAPSERQAGAEDEIQITEEMAQEGAAVVLESVSFEGHPSTAERIAKEVFCRMFAVRPSRLEAGAHHMPHVEESENSSDIGPSTIY